MRTILILQMYVVVVVFLLARTIIELIDFLTLGGSGGMLPQENF